MPCLELQVGNQSATWLSRCASSPCCLSSYTGVVFVDYLVFVNYLNVNFYPIDAPLHSDIQYRCYFTWIYCGRYNTCHMNHKFMLRLNIT